ncbi:Splicing factor [Vermiconidia calcicola]|uniref:Splicing factor n=1 Tax=Vermiconidia calcicola TaxID=1690605 RepID=A0ACC3MM29_9PEZI|nr:Splicing factor [Vermiconidia calcicola]
MNINSLLSPSDSPASSPSPISPARKVRPAGGKRTTSGLSQEVKHSPDGFTSNPTSQPNSAHGSPGSAHTGFHSPLAASAGVAPNFRPLQPTSNPSPRLNSPSYHGHPQTTQRPVVAHRPSSTPHMETLADLASMQQHHQTTRTHSANNVHRANITKAPRSPSLINPTASPPSSHFRNHSRQSLADTTMAEAPSQTPPPRSFESGALTEIESNRVNELLSSLAENSYAYEAHVELINLLHKGFLAHVYPLVDISDSQRDPSTYGLLTELRQAREAMDTRFAIGEDLWLDWLSDETLLAALSEERIALTELCQKAVQEEPASVKLWQTYANWVDSNYAACNDMQGANQSRWTDEDKEVCREFFTRDMVLNVLEQATAATQWRVDESHVLWNWYAELRLQDFPASPASSDIENLRNAFLQRLQVPHATWDETKQGLWRVVSKYEANNWEAIMDEVNERAVPAHRATDLRGEHELHLQRALASDDKTESFSQFSQYLDWESKRAKKPKQRTPFDDQLRCALYERALLRFPTYAEWWLDYVDLATSINTSTSILPLIERATRHCPWSGDLWARRMLQSDVEGKPHKEVEATKHRATNSGLLDVGGMEELVKVLQQWCSYLRRLAFRPHCSEDDLDTAEVGITMALEDIQQAGQKIYGKEFHGDPLYRLETIQIKFFSEARFFDRARDVYRTLVKQQKTSADFWVAYYHWELWLWGFERMSDTHRVETADNGPHRASAVAQQALSQRGLDQPERILNMYLNHFQQHESGDKLRSALIDAREFSKYLTIRRAKEAEEAAAQQQAYPVAEPQATSDQAAPAGEKRKREEENLSNGHSDKRTKTDTAPVPDGAFGEPSGSASAQVKRDRENNSITLKNLPADVQELDIKKFFRDVGAPVSITIIPNNEESAKATVEFESKEDVLAAKTRNGKELNGNEVRIRGGSQSTLYVANYLPEYDEATIRKLFESHGEIISVRFPSLKFDSRRRFCYVQFLTSDMAKAAEAAMDGKLLEKNYKLMAKISDPDAKKQRSGAQAEGRELFVKNLERDAPDHEIRTLFEQYGKVVSLNVVKLVNGKKTGTAFVVFSSVDEATAALGANNKPFHDRVLHVELATAKGRTADPMERARKEDVIIKQNASASPEPEGRRGWDVSMASSSAPQHTKDDESWKTAKERKVAVFNLPDTVNDARVRAAMERHGPLTKIQLRRDKGGAIVEFANLQDAFNVRQGVNCSSLGPEVKTGDVADLLAKERKRKAAAPSASAMAPPSLSRPGQQRGGRRGGLGFKRGGSAFGGARSGGGDGQDGGAKSNADFRSLFEKGKGGAPPEGEET